MRNELLLIASVVLIYGSVLITQRFLGKQGLYCFTSIATVAANIEVLIVIRAFGMEMTLGNVLFASTFLVTDILSELYGKEEAKKAVKIGIVSSFLFMIFSSWWLLYVPSDSDFVMPSMRVIFSYTPRVIFVSIAVYAIVQEFDVWAYHKWWDWTKKKFKDSRRFLWLRNNGSTLISQFLNNLLFTWGAFAGVYEAKTLWKIIFSGYVIFIATSLLDTPFVYIARKIGVRENREKA